MLAALSAFLSAHAAQLWPVVSGLLVLVIKRHTADEWLALGESNPRTQGAIKILAGLGLDPRKVYEGALQVLTAKSPPVPRASQLPATRSADPTPPVTP